MMLVGATGTRLHPVRTLQTLCQEEVASSSLDPTEASLPFREDPPRSEAEYYRKIKHPISLRTITAKARRGAYEGEAVESLWEDLRVLIKNAKTFNQPERWEWRAVRGCHVRRNESGLV
jgi:hypothetical protein